MLTFTRKVLESWKHWGYEQLFIEGPQGMGKTTYAMLVAYEVYRDWKTALYWTVFDPRTIWHEFDRRIEMLEAGELESTDRIPLVIFDDAGIFFSKYLYQQGKEGQELAEAINSLFNMIRSICAAVIFTSPDMDVLKELRKKSWWVGEPRVLYTKEDPRRIMTLYKRRITFMGAYKTKSAIDNFRLDVIPQWVRTEYNKKRGRALKQVSSRLRNLLRISTPQGDMSIKQ